MIVLTKRISIASLVGLCLTMISSKSYSGPARGPFNFCQAGEIISIAQNGMFLEESFKDVPQFEPNSSLEFAACEVLNEDAEVTFILTKPNNEKIPLKTRKLFYDDRWLHVAAFPSSCDEEGPYAISYESKSVTSVKKRYFTLDRKKLSHVMLRSESNELGGVTIHACFKNPQISEPEYYLGLDSVLKQGGSSASVGVWCDTVGEASKVRLIKISDFHWTTTIDLKPNPDLNKCYNFYNTIDEMKITSRLELVCYKFTNEASYCGDLELLGFQIANQLKADEIWGSIQHEAWNRHKNQK